MTLHSCFKLAIAASLVTGCAFAQAATTTVPGGRFGDVTVTQPDGPLRGFVVLYSQASGWSAADQQSADALAKAGVNCVMVDKRTLGTGSTFRIAAVEIVPLPSRRLCAMA